MPDCIGVRLTDILPIPEIDLMEGEGENVVIVMDHVGRCIRHSASKIFPLNGVTAKDKLVVAFAWQRMQNAPGISLKVTSLWRPVRDRNADLAIGKQGNDGMHTRRAIRPNSRQVHQHVPIPKCTAGCSDFYGLGCECLP